MKESWMNLELYFKSYEFYNFYGVFQIFYELIKLIKFMNFRFKLIKIIKIKAKSVLFLRGVTWMRHGTQGHVAVPRGPTQRLRGVFNYLYYLHNLYSKGIQPSVYWKGIHLTKPLGLINPTCFTNFFRVGLSPTEMF